MPARQTRPASSNWPRRLRASRLEVAVGEDDERPLAAELTGERNDVVCDGDTDVPRCLGRAGERDAAHTGVRNEGGTDLLSDSLHDVEDGNPASSIRSARKRARERRLPRPAVSTGSRAASSASPETSDPYSVVIQSSGDKRSAERSCSSAFAKVVFPEQGRPQIKCNVAMVTLLRAHGLFRQGRRASERLARRI